MNSISIVQPTAPEQIAQIPSDRQDATLAANFTQALTHARSAQTWISTSEASHASRPNIKEFMDRSGAGFLDASELIYGVVGSNVDVRDWAAIMASDDPITSARQATAQMYRRTDIAPRTDATYLGSSDTVAQEDNFAVRLLKDDEGQLIDQGLKLIDAQGLLLRDAGSNAEAIARNAWLFGFDTKPLTKLAEAAGTVSAELGSSVLQASLLSVDSENLAFYQAAPEFNIDDDVSQSRTSATMPGATEPDFINSEETLVDMQASAPELRQAISEATSSSFEYVDSTAYLNSFFQS